MRKKNNLALYTLLIAGLFSLLTINISAQNKVSVDDSKSQSINETQKILQNYVNISSLPMKERPKRFSDLSAADKANLSKLHLALQLVKRPNLTKEQKDIIVEGISVISADTYNKNDREKVSESQKSLALIEVKAKSNFSGKEGFEIFATLGGIQEDIDLLNKYQGVTKFEYSVERRFAFSKQSSQDKTDVVKIHLASQIAFRQLNKSQIEFISEMISRLTQEFYEAKEGSDQWSKKIELTNFVNEKVLDLFKKADAVQIIASFGGKSGQPENTEQVGLCSCSHSSDYCSWWIENGYCDGFVCQQYRGCGTFGGYQCTGLCTV